MKTARPLPRAALRSCRRGDVAGVILAGGLARRMGGGDKCLRRLGGRPILSYVIGRIRPQVRALALNANGPPRRFAAARLKVLRDPVPGRLGPLSGVLAGLIWARREVPRAAWLLSVPADAPFLPRDLVLRLHSAQARSGARIALAASGGRRHFVVALWSLDLAPDLEAALIRDRLCRVERFIDRYPHVVVSWPERPSDPFFNINRPADILAARGQLAHGRRPAGLL